MDTVLSPSQKDISVDNDLSSATSELLYLLAAFYNRVRIEIDDRLVQNKNFGDHSKSTAERGNLFFSAGEGEYAAVRQVFLFVRILQPRLRFLYRFKYNAFAFKPGSKFALRIEIKKIGFLRV